MRTQTGTGFFSSPLRGEGGAPSLGSAMAAFTAHSTAELSDLGAPGGGDVATRGLFTPTRNAIGLWTERHE